MCLLLGEPPGFPRPLPLVRFADKALRAFPEGVRFAAVALPCHIKSFAQAASVSTS